MGCAQSTPSNSSSQHSRLFRQLFGNTSSQEEEDNKKEQDLRVDLPTIGLKTLVQCKKAGLKGIVLKSKLNVCLDKKQIIKFANKNKMFIASI